MKLFSLAVLFSGTLALGVALVFLAMALLTLLPQGLVVLIFSVLGLVIVKSLIGILSRGLAARPASSNSQLVREQPEKEVIKPIQVSG